MKTSATLHTSVVLEQIKPHLHYIDPRVRLVEKDGATLFWITSASGYFTNRASFAVAIGTHHIAADLPLDIGANEIAERVKLAVEKLIWHVDRIHARDIVQNWPRGRSTMTQLDDHGEYMLEYIAGAAPRPQDRERAKVELDMNRAYHDGQARMMSDWHRSGGMNPSALAQMKLLGRLIEVKQ